MLRRTLVATLAVASLSALSVPLASADTFVRFTPAPRAAFVPADRDDYVWVPGHFEWRGHRRVFIEGAHVARRPAFYGDRDHDGVPNRFDRFPNNPYRF